MELAIENDKVKKKALRHCEKSEIQNKKVKYVNNEVRSGKSRV